MPPDSRVSACGSKPDLKPTGAFPVARSVDRVAAALSIAVLLAACGEARQRSIALSAPTDGVTAIRFRFPRAYLRIKAGPANRVGITGRIIRNRGEFESGSKRILANSSVEVVREGAALIVRPNSFARNQDFEDIGRQHLVYDLDLTVPSVPLAIVEHAGKIDITGSFPNLRIGAGAAEVHVHMPRGAVGELRVYGKLAELQANIGGSKTKRSIVMSNFRRDFGGPTPIEADLGAGQLIIDEY